MAAHACGFCYQTQGVHFVLTYCGMRWLCDKCISTV